MLACLVVVAWATITVPAAGAAGTADEIHYTFTSPDSVAFDWRGTANDISYGLTTAYGSTMTANTPSPVPFSSPGPFWEVALTGLSPGTTYHYSIGGGPDQTFSTAPTGDFRFDEIADVGSSMNGNTKVTATQSQIAADHPAFVLVAGDLTYGNATGMQGVDQHFNDVMAWSQNAAYMPAWGNHEYAPADDLRNYKGRFALPNAQTSPGAPAAGCCGEDWGWFDAGGVRFISYPEPYPGAWNDWQIQADSVMAAAQADPAIHFIVTYGHRPAYSTGAKPGAPELAAILSGFGDKYSKYVLNLNGHSHDYERFSPIHGVTNITAAGGGAGLELPWQTTDPNTAYRAMHLEHLRVDVSASAMNIQAICGPPTSKDDISCARGSVIDSVTINAPGDHPPTARLSATPSETVPLAVHADASASSDTDSTPIDTYSFDFGDGTAATGPQPGATADHTYQAPGTYLVTVTVTDTGGLSSQATAQVTATAVPPDHPPNARVSVNPTSGTVPLAVHADASASSDNDLTPIVSYSFDFGDGTAATGPQPGATADHTYQAPGTYLVTVTVTDTGGLSSQATAQVSVSGPNLVGNSGFETDTSGWAPAGKLVSIARVAGGNTGSWSAQLSNGGTSSVSCTLNDAPNWVQTTSAGTYVGSLWVRADSAGRVLRLRFREVSGSTVVGFAAAKLILSTSWQQASVSYTPNSPGSTSLDFKAFVSKASPGVCFYADDASIKQV